MKIQRKPSIATALPWNMVCVDFTPDEATLEAVQDELSSLGSLLRGLSTHRVHLHFTITRSKAAGDYFIASTLRVSELILQADETAGDLREGVRAACQELCRAVRSVVPGAARNQETETPPLPGFGAPMAFGEGPQSRREMVQALFASYYDRLVRYARRRLEFYVQSGALPQDSIDPRELVDEAALHCLVEPVEQLPRLNYPVWFHQVVRERLQRHCEEYLTTRQRRSDFPKPADQEDESEDLETAVANALDPDDSLEEDRLPDHRTRPPDSLVEESDLVALILAQAETWPEFEREVFTLHYLEGFSPEEVARLEGTDLARVREALERIPDHLRDLLRDEPYLAD